MASSYMSFSLLAKGIGHVTKNGHEKLDVILEPEDYYNLQSTYESELNAYQRKTREMDGGHPRVEAIPLHKTFITRKGALLLFSEDLAKKGQWEETNHRKKVRNKKELSWMTPFNASTLEHAGEDILKTCHDLSWAILSYGNKPEYRKRGEELYLRFVHQNNERNKEVRKIRPGFSPKRYISTWSHQWDNDLIERLISKGLIADKTLFTQNPHQLSGKFTNFNLSDRPSPYRVTHNMLMGSAQPGYEFYSLGNDLGEDQNRKILSTPPPSEDQSPRDRQEEEDVDEDVIQALKYHENGTIQQVEYSELQPKEKESILAELLVAAHEHQQNIRNTLTMITEDPVDGASESGAESSKTELMMDMNEAIMSLIASPVKQQMMERKQLQQQQQEQEELNLLKKREKFTAEKEIEDKNNVSKSKHQTDDVKRTKLQAIPFDQKNDPDYGLTFSHTTKSSEFDPISAKASKKQLKRAGNPRKMEVSDEELMTSYMNEQTAAGGVEETTTTTKMAPPPYKEKRDSLTSSVNKPVLFQPPISMNDKPKYSSSNTSSKRRGAMPISSNIVRQTLAGNLSILSASTQPNYDIDVRNIAEQISVPLPSIPEPNRQHGKIPAFSTLGNQPLAQNTNNNTTSLSSTTGREGDDERSQSRDEPARNQEEKYADDRDRDEDPDDPGSNDTALKSSLKGSSKTSQSSKLSQTRSRGLRTKLVPALPEKRYLHVEIPFHGMRGGKGPGSQSSASLIKSTGEPKKTESRNNLPQVVKKQQNTSYASVRMPDGEIMSIGGSITQTISTRDDYDYSNEDKSTLVGSDERKRIIRSTNIKSATSSFHEGGSTRRRVSFMEEQKVMEIGRHEDENDQQQQQQQQQQYDSAHPSLSGSRPTSSISSEKIMKHAKKVAAIVVKQQRPTSRLDDDARKAAQVWNEVIDSDDDEVDDDEDEDDEQATGAEHEGDANDDFNEDEEGYLLRGANKSTNASKRSSLTPSHHGDQRAEEKDRGMKSPTTRQTLHVDLQDKLGADTSQSSPMSTARDDTSSKHTADTKVSIQALDGSNSDTQRKSDASIKAKTDLPKDLAPTSHETPSKAKSRKAASSKSKSSTKSSGSKTKGKRKEKKEQQPTTTDPPAFRAGVPAESKTPEEPDLSPREDNKTRKEKKRSRKKDPETQVEKLLEGSDHSSRESDDNEEKRKPSASSTKTPSLPSVAASPVDDYDFVRVEEDFEDEEEEGGGMRERYDQKQDRILTDRILKPAGKRSPTAQEEEEEDQGSVGGKSEESKARMIAAKEERMAKRAAAAERRRMDVERKRREKDEQQRKEREELERKEQMQEQLEQERRQREEDLRKKKEQAELEKMKEQEEEEARKRRAEQQAEREKRMEEEKRKKREELQRKRKEEEEKRKEQLRIQEEEENERKKQEEEMLAQMEEEERIQYQEKMKKEREEKDRLDLERRMEEEEEVRKAMEYARKQAILKAHEQAILQQKLEFVRNMKDEGEKMTQAHKLSRAYNFSYFALLKMLGLEVPI